MVSTTPRTVPVPWLACNVHMMLNILRQVQIALTCFMALVTAVKAMVPLTILPSYP